MSKSRNMPNIDLSKRSHGYTIADRVSNAFSYAPVHPPGVVKHICPKTGKILKIEDPFERKNEEIPREAWDKPSAWNF